MNVGILVSTIFPITLFVGMLILKKTSKEELLKLR
jgi:hypothetical protein